MTRPVHHKLDIYGTELHAAYDAAGWNALRRRRRDLPRPSTLGHGLTSSARWSTNDQHHVWIWISPDRHASPAERIDTMAHEAAHAAVHILDRHAIPVDAGNGEPYAYLVGWLTAWLWSNQPGT